MVEDKLRSSLDNVGGNDSKVFVLFCVRSVLICLGDWYIDDFLIKWVFFFLFL